MRHTVSPLSAPPKQRLADILPSPGDMGGGCSAEGRGCVKQATIHQFLDIQALCHRPTALDMLVDCTNEAVPMAPTMFMLSVGFILVLGDTRPLTIFLLQRHRRCRPGLSVPVPHGSHPLRAIGREGDATEHRPVPVRGVRDAAADERPALVPLHPCRWNQRASHGRRWICLLCPASDRQEAVLAAKEVRGRTPRGWKRERRGAGRIRRPPPRAAQRPVSSCLCYPDTCCGALTPAHIPG